MAEKTSKLGYSNSLDPIARIAGANEAPDPFMEKYGDDGVRSDAEIREMKTNIGEQPEETEHIKAQIEETRSQMGETIDAIQEKLSFANVSEQVSEQVNHAIATAKDSIYDATIGKAGYYMKNLSDEISGSQLVKTVQKNPIPMVLIGLGAGMLAYQSFGRSKRPIRGLGRYKFRGDDHADRPAQRENESGESIVGRTYNSVTEKAGSAYSSASSAAGSALETVSGAVGDAYTRAGELTNKAYRSAGEYGSKAHQTYDFYIEENPLAVGAVAVALGAALGFALPSTRYESQLMGDARQNLLDKAQNAAGELVERAKHVADEAGKTIKGEARSLTQ
ncbi:MAG TPA: DUF3618 domain-containing protein [Pyrinomonadaceae bacterium]|nr:DUF3618 domain-containing protein [Pyrinomonadaceae bacterium]